MSVEFTTKYKLAYVTINFRWKNEKNAGRSAKNEYNLGGFSQLFSKVSGIFCTKYRLDVIGDLRLRIETGTNYT